MELSFRSLAVLFILLVWSAPADACPYCKERPKVWAGVFNEDFVATLLQVTLTIPLLIGIGLAFHLADRWPFRSSAPAGTAAVPLRRGPLLSAGVMIGIGLGGFLDGIFLPMLLQWHNLIAERVPPTDFVNLEINMFWDGVFNLGMWLITAAGLGLWWRAGRLSNVTWSGKMLFGTLLAGWGIFQVADSIFFHWVFRLHHIKMGSPSWLFWDVAYVVIGLVLVGVGGMFTKAGRRDTTARVSTRAV